MNKPKVKIMFADSAKALEERINEFIAFTQVFNIVDIKYNIVISDGELRHFAAIIFEETLTT